MVEITRDYSSHISIERFIVKNHAIKKIMISSYGIKWQVIIELKTGEYQVQIFYTKLSASEIIDNFNLLNDWWSYLEK